MIDLTQLKARIEAASPKEPEPLPEGMGPFVPYACYHAERDYIDVYWSDSQDYTKPIPGTDLILHRHIQTDEPTGAQVHDLTKYLAESGYVLLSHDEAKSLVEELETLRGNVIEGTGYGRVIT